MRNSHRQVHPTPSAPATASRGGLSWPCADQSQRTSLGNCAALVDAAHCPFAADDRVVLLDFLAGRTESGLRERERECHRVGPNGLPRLVVRLLQRSAFSLPAASYRSPAAFNSVG